MTERRRYTGTQRLQLAWTVSVILGIGVVLAVGQSSGILLSPVLLTLGLSVAWFIGLSALGLRERRRWNRLVEASSFTRQTGPHTADLEKITEGRSVTVSTRVPGPLSQTHTVLRTSVTGVDASFTVRFERLDDGETRSGPTTGNEPFDDRFAIEGSRRNVTRIVSPEIQSRLLDIRTPGICTVTGEYVSYELPFTSVSPEEFDTIAQAVVSIASRVEEVGRTG